MSKFLFGNFLFYGAVFGLLTSLLIYYFLPDFFLLFVHLSTICFYLALLYVFLKFVFKNLKGEIHNEKISDKFDYVVIIFSFYRSE